ncbi:hypothetical protein [Okeania sp. SIO2B3]|uniref:hypothetical protein n=1 Tax=Okeania sp. SIO2B3 TaxID=2607784 RepID=UPI0013BED1DF|nr:hypothetical protein [Okeania sp. SIO2B3]NET41051.1 hypothetical protein [Okeania sp. SIO2B3]
MSDGNRNIRFSRPNSSDNLTAKAKQILVRLNQQQVILVTTEFVLLEVADA